MKIAIIGHGNVGGSLALRWAQAGHTVTIGARDPQSERVQKLVEQGLPVATMAEAAAAAEVILVATPAHIATDIARAIGQVSGKIIIDATNAVMRGPDPYPTAFHALQDLTGARLAKCFNTTGYENMENPVYGDTAVDLFVAGSDTAAKTAARQLALDAGFAACYDFGGDDRVQLLEQFALAWINLAIFQGMGRNIAFKLLQR